MVAKIAMHPRNDQGEPFGMAPIVFMVTDEDIQPLTCDRLNRPFKACDGSAWYPVFESEIEWLSDKEL